MNHATKIGVLTHLKYRQIGESCVYTGSANDLPSRELFPTFATYQEADAFANTAYEDEIIDGIEIDIFKTGSQKRGNVRYVVGTQEDRNNKKLPKGCRWQLIYL